MDSDIAFTADAFVPELILSFVVFALIQQWSREGKLCPFAQPLSGVVIGMGVAAMAYLGDLSSCGLFNPAIAIV